MKIRIGDVQLELVPDYSAQEVEKAKDEVARWKAAHDAIWANYLRLASMVENAAYHHPLRENFAGVSNLSHESYERSIERVAQERDEIKEKYDAVCRAAHSNRGASHDTIVEHLHRIGASKQESVAEWQGRGRRRPVRRPRTRS